MNLEIQTMQQGYIELCQHVAATGVRTAPRGIETREIMGGKFILYDLSRTLPLGVNRKLSVPVAAVEAAQLIAGESFPELMTRINPTFSRFQDTPGFFHGAYGPRVREQMVDIVEILKADPDSRQAVVTIYNGQRDHVISKDIPCTTTLQFLLRKNRLNLHVNMRSNDVWWGTAYDVFQFTQLQSTVATVLGVGIGLYIHTAGSLHAYEKDIDAINELRFSMKYTYPYVPTGLAYIGDTMRQAQDRAGRLLEAAEDAVPVAGRLSAAEEWYMKHLSHVGGGTPSHA